MRPDILWYLKHQARALFAPRPSDEQAQIFAMAGWSDGVDLSAWQGAVDFAKLKTKVQFAYLRAGYGNNYFDPRCNEYRAGCKANGIPFGLYWFVVPGKSFALHAQNFYKVWLADPGSLPPAFDVEVNGGLNKTKLESWLKKMYNEFNRLSGLPLSSEMTYTSPGFLNKSLGLTNWMKWTQLWVAHWTTAPAPIIPWEWAVPNKTWVKWQYSARGIGKDYGVSSRWVDLDRGR